MDEQIKQFLLEPTARKVLIIFVGITIIWIAIGFIQRNVATKLKDINTRYKSKKILSVFGYVLSIVLILIVFSNKLGGLTIALGVTGAGIAFALQEVITSYAGWLSIILGGSYKTGDRIQLGGIRGDVMDIGVLRTTIMETGQWVNGDQYNGRIVSKANSFVFKEPVFNYSGEFPFLWDEVKIPVQYGSNYELANELFLKITRQVVGNLPKKNTGKLACTATKILTGKCPDRSYHIHSSQR